MWVRDFFSSISQLDRKTLTWSGKLQQDFWERERERWTADEALSMKDLSFTLLILSSTQKWWNWKPPVLVQQSPSPSFALLRVSSISLSLSLSLAFYSSLSFSLEVKWTHSHFSLVERQLLMKHTSSVSFKSAIPHFLFSLVTSHVTCWIKYHSHTNRTSCSTRKSNLIEWTFRKHFAVLTRTLHSSLLTATDFSRIKLTNQTYETVEQSDIQGQMSQVTKHTLTFESSFHLSLLSRIPSLSLSLSLSNLSLTLSTSIIS